VNAQQFFAGVPGGSPASNPMTGQTLRVPFLLAKMLPQTALYLRQLDPQLCFQVQRLLYLDCLQHRAAPSAISRVKHVICNFGELLLRPPRELSVRMVERTRRLIPVFQGATRSSGYTQPCIIASCERILLTRPTTLFFAVKETSLTPPKKFPWAVDPYDPELQRHEEEDDSLIVINIQADVSGAVHVVDDPNDPNRQEPTQAQAPDEFDSEPHCPAREPGENLLAYRARAACAIFNAACDFCEGRTEPAYPPAIHDCAMAAIHFLTALGRHDEVIEVLERVERYDELLSFDPDERLVMLDGLRKHRKRAMAARDAGTPLPELPAEVTSETRIAELGVPKRSVTILAKLGIATVGDFQARPLMSILREPYVGRTTIKSLIDALARADFEYHDPGKTRDTHPYFDDTLSSGPMTLRRQAEVQAEAGSHAKERRARWRAARFKQNQESNG
jgi:hypothetical protein